MRCARLVIAGALLALLSGCFIPYGGDLKAPRWDADGRHIFYLEQRFLSGPHPAEYERLYRATPQLGERTQVASGEIHAFPHPIVPSPNGTYVLVENQQTLILYDVPRQREVRRMAFESPWPMAVVWLPSSDAFSFTAFDGIHLQRVDSDTSRLVLSDKAFGLGWSADGAQLLYTTDHGWPQGNALHLLDTSSMADHVLSSQPTGLISNALFTTDGQSVVFSVDLIGGSRVGLYRVALAGGADQEIWGDRGSFVEGLQWTSRPDTLIFARRERDQTVTIECVDLAGATRRVASDARAVSFGWDYHSPTDALVFTRPDRTGFVVGTLAELIREDPSPSGGTRHE